MVGDNILLVVADGMGGHSDGDVAAGTLTDTLVEKFEDGGASGMPTDFLDAAIRDAHRSVHALGRDLANENRPRTTCSAAFIQFDAAWWAHVGDSRIYLFRQGEVMLRTRDHSHVESLVQSGEISEAEADDHPLRNWVDRCVGGERESPEIDFGGPEKLTPGDTILLCTDGFWEPLDETAVARYLSESRQLEEILEELAGQAVSASNPESDNVTVAALRVT